MLCPKLNCIHDSYPRTGEHVCAYSRCAHKEAQEAAIRREIAKLEELPYLSLKAVYRLVRLKVELESG